MKKTLLVLVCLLLMGTTGAAWAGQGPPAPPHEGAIEWALAWLGNLVDEAIGGLSGLPSITEVHRSEAEGPANAAESKPLQPEAVSAESGGEEDDGLLESGPLAEPFG